MVIGKLAELLVFGVTPLMLGVAALPVRSDEKPWRLSGDLTYRERMSLPPDTVATIEINHVSSCSGRIASISRQRIRNPGQVPIAFDLSVEPDHIPKTGTFVVRAEISVSERTLFATELVHDLEAGQNSPLHLILNRVS
ncbi:MAG: YbaY family lipoprotein [Rhizobiaceae bacterium]|nr:YbaY family lipoprotein [Rhizobiaceae bacterium]